MRFRRLQVSYGSPAEFKKLITDETEKWAKVLKSPPVLSPLSGGSRRRLASLPGGRTPERWA